MRRAAKHGLRTLATEAASWLRRRLEAEAGTAAEERPEPPELDPDHWALRSERFQDVLRRNFAQSGSELHPLIPLRLLRQAAERAGGSLTGEVLEIGSYGHAGFALALLLLGVERVHLDNVTPVTDRLARSHAETLYALMNGFGLPLRRRLSELVEPAGPKEVRIAPGRVVLHSGVDATQLDLPPGSLQAVFSMAVLEHVREPGPLLATTERLLAPGGWFFHAVDLRDHNDFSRPLRFLELTEEAYRAEDPGGNRWRGPDYAAALEAIGFELLAVDYAGPVALTEGGGTDVFSMLLSPARELFRPLEEVKVWVGEEDRARLQPEFQRYSLAELSGTSVNLTGRKRLAQD